MQSAQADPKASRLAQTAQLGRPVSCLKGVGATRAALLAKLGIHSMSDELFAAPHRYLDLSCLSWVGQACVGQAAAFVVRVDKVQSKRPRPNLKVVELSCYDDTGVVMVSFFGQPWLAQTFAAGQRLLVFGKVGFSFGFKRQNGPYWEILDEGQDCASQMSHPMLPVYHATEGLSAQWLRKLSSACLGHLGHVLDPWPACVRAKRRLMRYAQALRSIHYPASLDDAEAARRRLAFDEASFLQLALRVRRNMDVAGLAPVVHVTDGPHTRALRDALPFALSADQERAVGEILADMSAPRAMSRLLLGDVGTGKTAVATLCLGPVADTGGQAVLMAPTTVLAQQYADKIGPLLERAGICWALLTGATPRAARTDILADLATGECRVLFATQAALSGDVRFARLTLAVIDEQHRFGVNQRTALREKGRGADLLVMSATPIPRTMALAIYGDLDRSYLRQRPVQGAGVTTEVIVRRNRADAYDAMLRELAQGRQAYVVCPLVGTKAGDEGDEASALLDDGEDPSDPQAAEKVVKTLSETVFRDFRVGLLTGRMRPQEKAEVMAAFKAGEIHVLVSTTVIEVGVDVPNATVMLIEDAERFGLAQLHQLRGRVGRGQHPGRVFLCANATTPNARRRMKALEEISDGFELAEQDLQLRREGDIMGVRQSGEVALRFVDLARDADILQDAHDLAEELLAADPMLEGPSHAPVKAEVVARYGDVFRDVSGG